MHLETPLIDWQPATPQPGVRVRLKMENTQPSGSFKLRGLGHLATVAVEQGAGHLVISSGGNAGLAVAWAGRRLGVRASVVVPETTSAAVRERLEGLGAEVIVHGAVWDEADGRARELASSPGVRYVPPFDDPLIWEGHASLVRECARQGPKPGRVILSVGGGGLMSGVIRGLHEVGWSEVPVVAVETEGAASLRAAMDAGGPVSLERIESIAKTLGALKVAEEAYRWTRRHPVESVLVSDQQAVSACVRFADDHRVLVEPACGAALAVVYDRLVDLDDVLVVVCGGAGVSLADLEQWRGRGREEDG